MRQGKMTNRRQHCIIEWFPLGETLKVILLQHPPDSSLSPHVGEPLKLPAAAQQSCLPACLHLSATPARRGIAIIVPDPAAAGAKQTPDKKLLMGLFLPAMRQLLIQLINARGAYGRA